MKRVLTAVVLVPLVLLVVFRAPLWLFALVAAAVAILALHEYLGLTKAYGIEPLHWVTYALAVLLIFQAYAVTDTSFLLKHPWPSSFSYTWMALPGLAVIFGVPVIFRRDMKMALAASGVSAFALLYLGAPLAVLLLLRENAFSSMFLLFALFSVWAGDTAAYYVGRSIGRHKLAPIVSPGKTWEGAIASVVASVAVSFIVFHFQEPLGQMFLLQKTSFYTPVGSWPELSLAHKIGVGVLTNVAAQLGDLFESAIKRGAQVKDSGTLLPGHGGVLDRIDALLFAVPAVWYYARLITQ